MNERKKPFRKEYFKKEESNQMCTLEKKEKPLKMFQPCEIYII